MPENNVTDVSKTLPEGLRQQYLNAMGIQTWFDPMLNVAELNEAGLPGASASEAFQAESSEATIQAEEQLQRDSVQQLSNNNAGSNLPDINLSRPASVEAAGEVIATTVITQADSLEIKADKPASQSIDALNRSIEECTLCELHTCRPQAIVGQGCVSANLLIITDAPVGESLLHENDKKMLQAMLRAINIDLSSVYLTSLVKCQPPEQRSPQISEVICCDDHLSAQIKLIQPRVLLVLGEQASQQLLVSQKSLSDLRLRQHKYLAVPVYASYHPQSLVDSVQSKRKVWSDLLQISKQLQN